MADILTTLIQSAVLKKAALMEQWMVQHAECYPGPSVEFQTDKYNVTTAHCSCGESFEVATVVSTLSRVIKK